MTPPPDLDKLAEDWITLWQSELGAMAADPALAEAWAASVALGAAWWRAQKAGFGAQPGQASPPGWPWAMAMPGPPAAPPAWTAGWVNFATAMQAADRAANPGPADPAEADAGHRSAPSCGVQAPAGGTGPVDAAIPSPAGPPAVGPAPDGQRDARGSGAGDGAGDVPLAARLAEFERRLADLEGGPGRSAANPPGPRRRKRQP